MVPPEAPDPHPEDAGFIARLDAAARSIGRPLSAGEIAACAAHHRLLRKWDSRMNLTGLKEDEAIVRRHFLEPIAVADLLAERGRLVDLGSGNGFPAIPLNVLRPGLDLVMVESSEKKSEFLQAVIEAIGLTRARVVTRRVTRRRDLADLLPATCLTFRAVRGRDMLKGEGGPPILEPGGRLLAFVSPDEAEALRRRPISGLRWAGCRPLPSGPRSAVVVMVPAHGGAEPVASEGRK